MPDFLPALTGSFATSAAQNPTVAIMEAAFADAGLHCRYVNCEVPAEALADAVRGAIGMGWIGFNCSIPHKVAILEHLDELAPSAAIIGAVNTVVIRREAGAVRLIGENTDGQGFVTSLREVRDPAGQHVVILGAGGAARAIAVETALAGALSITIVNRTAERGEALADLVDTRTDAAGRYLAWTPNFHVPHGTGVLINATSIGFHPNEDETPDVDVTSLAAGMVVADVVANPPRTRFLAAAADQGCITLDGLGMLVNQAIVAVRLWTGRDVSATVMRGVLEELFSA
jgi:shikimate dehydrogenase